MLKSKHNLLRKAAICLSTLCFSSCLLFSQTNLKSKDGYVRRTGNEWIMGTSRVEQRIRLAGGQLQLVSLRNKVSGKEYQDGSTAPTELFFLANGEDVSAPNWHWELQSDRATLGKQGELQLVVTLQAQALRVSQHYVVYPGTSVIREWLTLNNTSAKPIEISHLDFLHTRLLGSVAQDLQFNYVTGSGNYNGSQLLKSEPMSEDYERVLDSKVGIQTLSYSAFLPLVFLLDHAEKQGVAVGWDYLGHWRFEIGQQGGMPFSIALEVAGFQKELAPGSRIETPKAFLAPFSGGVDELGNQLLDWQYAYMWEFTNPDYFAKTRWAVDWPDPWVGDGGTPSGDNWGRRLALDLRYIDLLRETGTDILWDDAGWYDKWGTWNSPDWKLTTDYLRKQDMRWVLWFPTFLATPESKVAQEHPDWTIPGEPVLEQSIPATADWQDHLLDDSVKSWGDYQWRYDIAPAVSANDTDYLASDQNFRRLLEEFKSDHPHSGVDACYGGGRWISYDIARLAESGEYTDGGVGPYSAYYTSLIVSPDKLHNVVDFDHTYYDAASDNTHLAMDPTWYRDPGDGPNLDLIRQEWEIYHYLADQGVVGRWSHIFRPKVDHDDPVWYFQRMNRDGTKGVILTKHAKQGPTYYIISRLSKQPPSSADEYRGNAGGMNRVTTTSAIRIDTGIYQDPVDGAYRFYGVPGQEFGPLNLKYHTGSTEESLVTKIVGLGADRKVSDDFFGMAVQVEEPTTVTQLGQFDPGKNRGVYTLSLVRAEDGKVLATADLDMSHTYPDAMGFKYARLAEPVQLDSAEKPVTIYPRGLSAAETYEVRGSKSGFHVQETGAKLMSEGISLDKVPAGELIFLNLPHYPGSGTDHTAPTAPSEVTKRVGTNLGKQGIEISWKPAHDDNWISYYEIQKDGKVIGKTSIGTFFFDHSDSARNELSQSFEVVSVDGDGNRSSSVSAQEIPGESPRYEALGDFSPIQAANQWTYEEQLGSGSYRNLTWEHEGYEGLWVGSGLGRIGRIWMQPSAQYDLSRTFVVPAAGVVSTAGSIRKDPSADNHESCFVRILLNSRQVWPEQDWAEVKPDYDVATNYSLANLQVAAGDKLRFMIKHNGADRPDPVVWDPTAVMGTVTSGK